MGGPRPRCLHRSRKLPDSRASILKFMHACSDGRPLPARCVHDQLYVGGLVMRVINARETKVIKTRAPAPRSDGFWVLIALLCETGAMVTTFLAFSVLH